jgi:tetratricopeptide (TPR) repeat protein
MRSSRGPEATAVWQKAIALEPDHAETLEQLVAVLTSQNRLIEASGLAERLARLPAFELGGELRLASLRAELGDPAGAAALLHQALARPEAARLDAASRAQYRKLLARTLLETGQPAQARSALDEVLKAGSDPQASWLLSRAALLVGAKSEANAALEAAGTYRADHPLEWEPARYVGEDRCAKCHHEIFQAHIAGRHFSTLLRGAALAAFPFPAGSIPDPDHPAVTHRFRKDGGRVEFQTEAAGRVHRAVLAYAFGSPDHYVSFVGSDDQGQPSIIRLSRYQSGQESGWVRTTGHSVLADDPRAVALGKPLEAADGIYKCLYCHATAPSAALKNIGPEAGDRGIGCERCHGPGGNHLEAVKVQFADPAIVSPADASGEARIGLCGQCHGHHQESTLPHDDPFWIRFQATTLAWSRCSVASNGALDCVTCHDPHHNAEQSAAHYEAKCLACHSRELPSAIPAGVAKKSAGQPLSRLSRATPGPLATRSVCPVSPAKGCLPCHMPSYRSEPLHADFADHYIRVHADSTGRQR